VKDTIALHPNKTTSVAIFFFQYPSSIMMRFSPFISSISVISFFSFLSFVYAQSIPGGTFFNGPGAPAAGPYQLVDDYEPSTFFNKFNFYSVCMGGTFHWRRPR